MDTWIPHRNRNRSTKAANNKRKSRRDREERADRKATLGVPDTSIHWHRVKYSPHNLYPKIRWVNDHPTRSPSAQELQSAMEEVSSYHLLTSGINVIRDPLDQKSIIAIIEFTPFSQLTPSEKDDLNFVSTFLHQTKPFISPVRSSSRVWGGLMWALGWRKSYDEHQMAGRYIKKIDLSQIFNFNSHYQQSPRLGHIIGTLFKNLAKLPFQSNQDIMKKYNIPSFADLSYGQLPEDSTCSPHITFTTNGFFNPPHKDKDDISQYAFVLFLPTRSSDGSLVDSSKYDITSGPFIFPDHKFGINFDQQHGIVKMIWQANKYTHCTMPHSSSQNFTRLGLSVQINASLTAACDRYNKGFYKDVKDYFATHFYYLFDCLKRFSIDATTFGLFIFFTFGLFF